MTQILNYFILLPIFGFLISLLIPDKKETLISSVAFLTVGLHLMTAILFVISWFIKGCPTLNVKDIDVFRTTGYDFFVD